MENKRNKYIRNFFVAFIYYFICDLWLKIFIIGDS